ncbi:melanocyte-stimulating hormone receptor-like [Montipora capricornis]|uniref:melanocyte-stimulating hormone receptor-like n=1 Tax=Montipora foliosa TaxID=591990 RepID=UPI0035F169F7
MINNSDFENISGSFPPRSDDVDFDIHNQLSSRFYLSLVVIEIFLASAVTLSNFLLLVVIYRDPLHRLRTPTTYLMANLGIADFLVGAILGYCRAVENYIKFQDGIQPKFLNTAQYAIAGAVMLVIAGSIMAMSWDRFVAVSDPFNYNNRITVKRVKICMLGIWLNASILTMLPVAGVRKLTFLFAYCYSHFLVPAVALTIVYIMIFRTLSRKLQTLNKAVRSEKSVRDERSVHREHRLTVTIVLVLIAFYACFAPYFLKVHLWLLCSCAESPSFLIYHFTTNDIMLLSSLVDPIIYAWRLQSFRKSFRYVLGFERDVAPVT